MGWRDQSGDVCKDGKVCFICRGKSRVPEWAALLYGERPSQRAPASVQETPPGTDPSDSVGPLLSTVSSFLSPFFFLNYRFYGNIIVLTAQKSSDCRCTSDSTFFSVVYTVQRLVKQEAGEGGLPGLGPRAALRGAHEAGAPPSMFCALFKTRCLARQTDTRAGQRGPE